jgi:hypothetical protein
MAIPIHRQRGFFVFLSLVLLFFAKTSPPLKGPIADQNGLYCVRADKPIHVAAIISWKI